jgi:hypothetical protein
LRKKYPQYNIGPNDQFDPEKNALMGALLSLENAKLMSNLGVSNPSPADLYLSHFLGASGAAKLIKAPQDSPASSYASAAAVSANRSIFDGKSVAQVRDKFSAFITPRAIAYADFGNKPDNTA